MAMTSAEIEAAIAEGKAAVDDNDWSAIKAGIASSTKGADVREHIYATAHAASLVVEEATEAMEDYPQLKADIANKNDFDKEFYTYLVPYYIQSDMLAFGKAIGLINGYYVDPNSGLLNKNANYCATDYLPVASTRYRSAASDTVYYAFYDSDKNYISGGSLMGTRYINDISVAVKYIRYSCTITAYDSNIFRQWDIVTDPILMNIGENIRVPYAQVTDAPTAETETVVSVSDYTNLRVCLETIQPTENNHYIVNIPNGTYDVRSMYTDAERAVSGFRGLFVPNYTKLVGTGSKENTIIRYDNTEDESISQNISTLHFRDWVEMENLTVIGTRIRYAIHDDFQSTANTENHRVLENCDVIVYESYYNDAYGAGVKGGADWTFRNCVFNVASVNAAFSTSDFLRAWSVHGATGTTLFNKFLFDNCIFKTVNPSTASLRIASMSSDCSAYNYVTFKGCVINGKILMGEENTSYGRGNLFKIGGYSNNFDNEDVTLSFTDGVDYSSWIALH